MTHRREPDGRSAGTRSHNSCSCYMNGTLVQYTALQFDTDVEYKYIFNIETDR